MFPDQIHPSWRLKNARPLREKLPKPLTQCLGAVSDGTIFD
jgi:hypothetical protein